MYCFHPLKIILAIILLILAYGCSTQKNGHPTIKKSCFSFDSDCSTQKWDTIYYEPMSQEQIDKWYAQYLIDTMYIENDTLFLSHFVDINDGDTCTMNHFLTPASNVDYRKSLALIPSDPFIEHTKDEIDTAYEVMKGARFDGFVQNDLQDFPRVWCSLWPYRGKYYRTKDCDEIIYFTDSTIVVSSDLGFYISPLCSFKKDLYGCYSYSVLFSLYLGNVTMESVMISPVLNVPNLYLFTFYLNDKFHYRMLYTPLEHLGQFDFIDIKGCMAKRCLDYDNIDTILENGVIQIMESQ